VQNPWIQFGKRGAGRKRQLKIQKTGDDPMARDYQREERERRRRQPPYQEGQEGQWSNSRSDDDFSMGLGQEGRGSQDEDYGRRRSESGGREGRENRRPTGQSAGYGQTGENARFGPHRGGEGDRGDWGRDEGNEPSRNSSRWQRSQFHPSEGDSDIGGRQEYGRERGTSRGPWEEYDNPQRSWYQGPQDAMQRREGQFAGRGPRNYKRSDERIEEDINERLTRHAMVDATEIEVTVKDGEVTLRGFVDNRQAKRTAEDIVDAVSGVKEVTNQLKVKQRGEGGEEKRESGSDAKQRKAG
jgi:hypothetical protein